MLGDKNQEKTNETFSTRPSESYEEVSEKRTSALGYILLIVMAVFMIGIGQTIFSDLRKIPERPTAPAHCVSAISNSNNLNGLSHNQKCRFTEIDEKFSLDSQYNNISSQVDEIASLKSKISKNTTNITTKEREISKLNKDYDLSLQEKMAGDSGIMNSTAIQNSITFKRNEINNLKKQNRTLESQRDSLVIKITPQVNIIKGSYTQAQEEYKDKNAFYQFKIFLLMLLFVLPFFAASIYFYLKLKKKNSPYTVIFTAIAGASSILFLQTVLMFLYQILPKEWLTRIFKFFMDVPFLRYIVYYGSVILVIALFGGIVYFIQKRVFSPAKVAIRRLKDKKCPGCSFALNSDHNYCPKCGQQIKEKCVNCGKAKIRYLAHCPNCGKK